MDVLKESLPDGLPTIYLGLGSNLGDRKANLKFALSELGNIGRVGARSGIYETAAWGYEDDKKYLNAVVEFHCRLNADSLFEAVKKIEAASGRTAGTIDGQRYSARTLDIDILLYGDRSIHSDRLHIPHPRLHLRNFVLWPLAEIAPDLHHPGFGLSMRALMVRSTDSSSPQKWTDEL